MPPPPPTPRTDRPWVVVVAAGGGRRFGAAKQYAGLAGRRVIDWSLAAAHHPGGGVVLVVPLDDVDRLESAADVVVAGGTTRSASVRAGLAVVPPSVEVVVVHDAARPAAGPDLFDAVVAAVRDGADAAVPGVPVVDSLRRRDGVAVDRDELVAVQTPQAFRATALRAAHASAAEASDDATLVERHGGRVVIVPGDPGNTKVTHPGDLELVATHLRARATAAADGGA